MKKNIKPCLLQLIPAQLFTYLIGLLASCEIKWFKNLFIRIFINRFKVDMSQAAHSDHRAYSSFNEFFARAIKKELRPITAGLWDIASPVDGTLSEFGAIEEGKLLQAKGIDYSREDLLGGDSATSRKFLGGSYATFYLSPKDYHRVHMPLAGTLHALTHVPGKLFSVSTALTSTVPNIYTRNERMVCYFDGEFGPFIVVMVGAMGVGSISTSWSGLISNHAATQITTIDYPATGTSAVSLKRGDELGYFSMGSTAIVLLPPASVEWQEGIQVGQTMMMGEKVARFVV